MANKTDRRSKYRGDLARNIFVEPLKKDATLVDLVDNYNTVAIAHESRLGLLLDSYSIPPDFPDKWKNLSIVLAITYVPGFKTTHNRKGAPAKWTSILKLKLLIDVNSTKISIMEKGPAHRPTDIAALNIILDRANGVYPVKGKNRESQVRNLGNILSKARKEISDGKL